MNSNISSGHNSIMVQKQSIILHDHYDHFAELLAISDYLLPSAHSVQKNVLAYCLLMHPMLVIKARGVKDRYVCVGGIRSFLLAQAHCNDEEHLPVIQIERPDIDTIKQMINTDVLVAPMLFSLRSPKAVGTFFQKLSEEDVEGLFTPKNASKTALAKNMGVALNTVFPPAGKRSKGE